MEIGLEQVVSREMLGICRGVAASPLGRSFYLAGSTGLAMQLRHRRSLDLDFFQREPSDRLVVGADRFERLFGSTAVHTVLRQPDQITWSVAGVQVTFMAYPFSLVTDLVRGADIAPELGELMLASPKEIALMKAYAIGRQATFRDYVDLHAILARRLLSLEDLVANASRKFVLGGEPLFPTHLFLQQLVYIKDLPDVDAVLRLVHAPLDPRTVADFFSREVDGYIASRTRYKGIHP